MEEETKQERVLKSYDAICPKCKEEGEESKLHLGCGFTTSAGVDTYYDSSGRWHEHDPNLSRGDWSCSRKHKGSYSKKSGCPSKECSHRGSLCIVYIENPNPKEARKDDEIKVTVGTGTCTVDPKATVQVTPSDKGMQYYNITPSYYTYTMTQTPGTGASPSPSPFIDLKNLVLGGTEDSVHVAINVKGVVYTGTLTATPK
jgi:hypothetical protein